MQLASAGPPCLLAALSRLPVGDPLRQEIVRTPAHVLYLLHHGGGSQIVGAVLHGKPREALPPLIRLKAAPRGRLQRPVNARQLDLFETISA
jgi:hypothetical protein